MRLPKMVEVVAQWLRFWVSELEGCEFKSQNGHIEQAPQCY